MSDYKVLGSIRSVSVGHGGYQGVQFGVVYGLGGKGWGTTDAANMVWATERTAGCKWTEADRVQALGNAMVRLMRLMETAGVKEAHDLVGKPIECTFDGPNGRLVSWRLLDEVL